MKTRNKSSIDGKRFGRLLVIGKAHGRYWNCICACSKITTVRRDHLTLLKVRSCGCLNADVASSTHSKHNAINTPEYKTWCHMKERCLNPNCKDFKNYGGRGINVCDRWMYSFINFFTDMGEKPPGLTIERLDVNGDYEPSNCAWRCRKEQSRNRRNNVLNTGLASEVIRLRKSGVGPSKISKLLGISVHSVENVIYRGSFL